METHLVLSQDDPQVNPFDEPKGVTGETLCVSVTIAHAVRRSESAGAQRHAPCHPPFCWRTDASAECFFFKDEDEAACTHEVRNIILADCSCS